MATLNNNENQNGANKRQVANPMMRGNRAFANYQEGAILSDLKSEIKAGIEGLSADEPTNRQIAVICCLPHLVHSATMQTLVKDGAKASEFVLKFKDGKTPAYILDVKKADGSMKDLSKYVEKKKGRKVTRVGYASVDEANEALIDGRYLVVPCTTGKLRLFEEAEKKDGTKYNKTVKYEMYYDWNELLNSATALVQYEALMKELAARSASKEAYWSEKEEWVKAGKPMGSFYLWKKAQNAK